MTGQNNQFLTYKLGAVEQGLAHLEGRIMELERGRRVLGRIAWRVTLFGLLASISLLANVETSQIANLLSLFLSVG